MSHCPHCGKDPNAPVTLDDPHVFMARTFKAAIVSGIELSAALKFIGMLAPPADEVKPTHPASKRVQ